MPAATTRVKYRRKASGFVIAIRLDLDMDALKFRKWGAKQRARRGDWLADNGGDVYTVAARTFASTYRRIAPGHYLKKTPVWAEEAQSAGRVKTQEGYTHYKRGDFIVSNRRDGTDGYAIARRKFLAMYERVK
jgi:hypothetical protein